jgi:catechol 2,3-dioxygenase-like lactoylglutathione lyase family enzyme
MNWRVLRVALLSVALICVSLPTPAARAAEGKVLGIAFNGRIVKDLDRSVAFYKSIGFSQDPLAKPDWRRDEVIEQVYNVKNVETRMAKMFVMNTATNTRWVVYLRELRGLDRKDLSNHTAWDPGVSHFGLVVPDADAVWSKLKASGQLRARSWDSKLIAPPGQTKGMLAYMTDPDGIDIEIIEQRPATPPRPALSPGVNHVGLVVLDSDKARAFYGDLFGGELQSQEAPWLQGDFFDSAVGGHGNILRFFNYNFGLVGSTEQRMHFELVEFQNRKTAVVPRRITDIGVGYVGFEVQGLDAFLEKAKAAGAQMVSTGIATMRGTGVREVMVRDPDVGGFVLLYENPPKK